MLILCHWWPFSRYCQFSGCIVPLFSFLHNSCFINKPEPSSSSEPQSPFLNHTFHFFFFRLLMDGTGNGYKNGKEGANLNPILSMLQANLLRIKVNQPFQRKRSYFKKWKWMKKALPIKDDSTILMLKRYNNYSNSLRCLPSAGNFFVCEWNFMKLF